MTAIKIFRINDSDYVAARSHEEAVAFFCELVDSSLDDIDAIVELDDETMRRLRYYEEEPTWNEEKSDYDLGPSCTFEEALQEKIKQGEDFPLHFASNEW